MKTHYILSLRYISTFLTKPASTHIYFISLFWSPPVGQGTLNYTTHPASREVVLGESVTITCSVSDPNAEIYWLYENVTIDSSHTDYTISGSSLTISNFTISKSGHYRCAASNDNKMTVLLSHTARLTAFSKLNLFVT